MDYSAYLNTSPSANAVKGRCLCESIRYAIEMPTVYVAHCHCTLCQRAHGAAYVTWCSVLREQFSLQQGLDQLGFYASSEHTQRVFCKQCGSSLMGTSTEYEERIEIAVAHLEGPLDKDPEFHVFFGSHGEWASYDDSLPRLGGESGIEPLDAAENS